MDEEDEDALMQRALEMSMMEMLTVTPAPAAGVSAGQESKAAEGEEEDVRMMFLPSVRIQRGALILLVFL